MSLNEEVVSSLKYLRKSFSQAGGSLQDVKMRIGEGLKISEAVKMILNVDGGFGK